VPVELAATSELLVTEVTVNQLARQFAGSLVDTDEVSAPTLVAVVLELSAV
jgi:hypothetical protein